MTEGERGQLARARRRGASRDVAAVARARDGPSAVFELQALAGNRAVTQLIARSNGSLPTGRTAADVVRDLEALGAEIHTTRSIAGDLIMERGGRPGTLEETLEALRGLARGGDTRAATLLEELEQAVARRSELIAELGRLTARSVPGVEPGGGEEKFESPHEGKPPPEKPTQVGAEPSGAASAEEAGATTASRVEGAAVEAEEALIDRIGASVGSVVEGLLPTPLDALMLEAQFAGSYEDAWEAIEKRNTRGGITLGITAGIMGLDEAWVKANVWRRTAVRDVETEILGAVGKAERAFNDGLLRGHRYGFGHPPRLKKKILGRAYRALAQRGIQVREEDRDTFATLTQVAGVLTPLVDDFLQKVATRRRAREEEAMRKAGQDRFKATHGRF